MPSAISLLRCFGCCADATVALAGDGGGAALAPFGDGTVYIVDRFCPEERSIIRLKDTPGSRLKYLRWRSRS